MQGINFSSCVKVKNKIWFVSVDKYFMNYDYMKSEISIVSPQNAYELNFGQIVDQMMEFQNKIYFVEQDGSYLYEYDIEQNCCNKYKLPETEMINWGCFSGIYIRDKKIYFFTKNSGKIFCFNLQNKQFENLLDYHGENVYSSVVLDDIVYLVSANKILCYNLNSNQYNKEYLFQEEIYSITVYGTNIYLLTKKNKVIKWRVSEDIKSLVYECESEKQIYGRVLITSNKLYLLPCEGKEICSIDKKSNIVKTEEYPVDFCYKDIGWAKYTGYFETDDEIWCANRVANYMLMLDKHNEKIKWFKTEISHIKNINYYLREKGILYEQKFSLQSLIELLIEHNKLYKTEI